MTSGSGNIPTHHQSPTLPFSSVDNFLDVHAFGPTEHLRNLHPEVSRPGSLRRGVLALAQRVSGYDKPWHEWTARLGGDAILQVEELFRRREVTDLYVSQAAFRRWRGIADLTAVGACYVDLDYHTRERWKGIRPRDVAAAVIGTLEEAQVPLPSYILATGRGLCCVWLVELLPPTVLPRWNLVQRTLADRLTNFGSDKRAPDAARVFRVVGSENARAEWDHRVVQLVWFQGAPHRPNRYSFGSLADEVLPFTQAELVSLRAERAKRDADKTTAVAPAQKLDRESYWTTALADLHRLRFLRNPETGTLPAGHRDAWIFVAATALSWIAPAAVMEREIAVIAAQAAGWPDRETTARMSAVIKRARLAQEGKLLLYDGREVDARYRMKAATIVEWLQIEPSEMKAANLRVLVDSDRRRELNTERSAVSRRRKGAKSRDDQRAARRSLGNQCLYVAAKDGLTVRELAERFQVSTGHISAAMKEAREQPMT